MITTSTCVIGLVDKSEVWMGSDSSAVSGLHGFSTRLCKHFELQNAADEKFLIGYTSSYRFGQLLEHVFVPPINNVDDPMKYMVSSFIPEVIKMASESWKKRADGKEHEGIMFLVGYRGRLFVVESDYQVNEPRCQYYAIGCGRDLALGSLHTTDSFKDATPGKRIDFALRAACEFSAGVMEPFNITSI